MNDLLKKILYFKKEGSLLIILLYCILNIGVQGVQTR